ncbi:MAG: RHS repeat-associated core domain-containing protein [Oscillospiraceae bacterium]|nr:RHS repeat-associated core domain-containing protein [Oscillospiraceae bacterium]
MSNTRTKEFQAGVDTGYIVRGWNGTSVTTTGNCTVGQTGDGQDNRMYLQLPLPEANASRIKKAELILHQQSYADPSGSAMKLGVYRVSAIPEADATALPEDNGVLLDVHTVKTQDTAVTYAFDITNAMESAMEIAMESAISGEEKPCYLMVKPAVTLTDTSYVNLFGSGAENPPTLRICYETNFSIQSGYREHSHSLGRFGQGSIDLACGNLTIQSEDFAWGGNRMPVTLRHLYTSALSDNLFTGNSNICLQAADFSAMHMGNGWKLNVMQSMVPATFLHKGSEVSGFVWLDENSTETRFCPKEGSLYEAVEDSSLIYDATTRTLTRGDETLTFDAAGRLVSIADEFGNTMTVTWNEGRIENVTDGAGRSFVFAYNDDSKLTRIAAPDDTPDDTSDDTSDGPHVDYTYEADHLTAVTYPDGVTVSLTYENNKPKTVTLPDGSGVSYTFTGNRVTGIQELSAQDSSGNSTDGIQELSVQDSSDNSTDGKTTAFHYSAASGKTTLTTTEPADGDTPAQTVTTVYSFDDEGEVVGSYVYGTELSPVGIGSGIHPYYGDGGAQTFGTARNLLSVTSFELEADNMPMGDSLFGEQRLRFSSDDSEATDVLGTGHVMDLQPGVYTFSGYVRFTPAAGGIDPKQGAFLRVLDANKNVVAKTERIWENNLEYTRLSLPFVLTEAQTVKLQMCMDGAGTTEVDGIQLNEGECAEPFNLMRNGSFEKQYYWNIPEGAAFATGDAFHGSGALKLSGDLSLPRYARQSVPVRSARTDRETFTLSGWAKAQGLPMGEREEGDIQPTFRLRAEIHYADEYYGETDPETFTADFSPCTDEWQYVSLQFSKSKYRTVEKLYIYCDYDYNCGDALFDDIQLVRNALETGLSAEDFSMETVDAEVADYTASDDTDSNSPPAFEELKDFHGNPLTETTYHDGEFGTIYRAFRYSENGNDKLTDYDPRGNSTNYTVNAYTSRTEAVEDRCGNKTLYEYDKQGRTTKVKAMDSGDTVLAEVSYAYNNNGDLVSITRGDGMTYTLAYDAFHNLQSIQTPDETPLIHYAHKSGNGRLKQVTYANGDTMKAGYNPLGQLVSEMWYNSSETLTAHYRYTYDHQGNIVRSVDILAKKEYNYSYEEGRLLRATECDITLDEATGMVTAKTLVNTLRYYYDREGTLVRRVSNYRDSQPDITFYDNDSNDSTMTKNRYSDREFTCHSKTDAFGRKVFDEVQFGFGTVSRQFLYENGAAPQTYATGCQGCMKSTPTTQLVKQIILSDGRTISYEYDAEERITKVTDSLDGITQYTYDAQGQLLTETRNGVAVNVMTYDNYGNILTKNGKEYEYEDGDKAWKDKLTSYNGVLFDYDPQGNPIHYFGSRMYWGKGRQLMRIQNGENEYLYTYNASGIRTSKTVGGVKHSFTLDGAKILRDTWTETDENGNALEKNLTFLYDNEDTVCGFQHNAIMYYYLKNLQGDVIAIVNESGTTVARYTYDAWGACTVSYDATATATGETEPINIATVNPFRYRSYYFDTETGLYYLQSRYYDPALGRFISADVMLDTATVIGFNLFAYCGNNPIMHVDPMGYARTYVIYYNKPGSGFYDQAMNSPYYNRKSNDVYMLSVISNQDFIDVWNCLSGTIDYVYLYLHGGKGVLYFSGESLSFSGKQSFSSLKSKTIKKGVYLFSCKGGAGSEGNNVAWMFAKLTGTKVYACTGSVSYSKIFGKYYARKAWDLGIIKTFYYQKTYTFGGTAIAKSVLGQW